MAKQQDEHRKYFNKDGKEVPSCTTIIKMLNKPELVKWANYMGFKKIDTIRARTGFWKNKKPMLVLRPRIDFDGSSNWFYGSTMMTRVTHSDSPMEFCDLVEVMHDDENRVSVQYIWNRYKVLLCFSEEVLRKKGFYIIDCNTSNVTKRMHNRRI